MFLEEIRTLGRQDNVLLTAEDGTDFVGFEDVRLIFPAGERLQHYTIDLAYGVDVDTPEYFEVCLENPMYGSIDAPDCAIVYIEDDDCRCIISFGKCKIFKCVNSINSWLITQ